MSQQPPPQPPYDPNQPQQPYYGQQPQYPPQQPPPGYYPPQQGYQPPIQQPGQQYYQTDASGYMPAQDTKGRGRQQPPPQQQYRQPQQGYQQPPQGYYAPNGQPVVVINNQPRRSVLGIGCLVIIGLIIVSGIITQVSQRPTTPANQVATIGQKVSVPNWDLVVGAPTENKTLKWSQYGNSSTAVGTFLVVPVDITNASKQAYNVNGFDFEIIDNQGRVYETSTDFGTFSYSKFAGGQDVSDTVPAGVTVKIYLVFDVNSSAQGLKMMFKQGNNPQVSLGL